MPRGMNPNSRANLIKNSDRTPRERSEQASKAGKASGEARSVYKSLNEDLRERCTPERIAKINSRILSMAEHGNLKAYELIRDGLGEKPRDEVKISGLEEEQSKLSELIAQRRQRRMDDGEK